MQNNCFDRILNVADELLLIYFFLEYAAKIKVAEPTTTVAINFPAYANAIQGIKVLYLFFNRQPQF